ncbi:MAG: hypothetical protein CVU57_21120 [Deltaproteobacteria bacterium HGW-Deltaproteobacteria-15]|jgi:hypothetical protein|nr:MAG: hypothetical protein CVU57_21120 [Deltaproteobacteria bacterium HGW-Deltaproteobacteria-15]
MRKLAVLIAIGFMLSSIAGCATVKDVQRASDLIRTDNELTRLLLEVRPEDHAGAETYLNALADHAKGEADILRNSSGSIPDAIAYYRIAATAYWRSGRNDVANNLFEVTENGSSLCAASSNKAPDRDCMFLQLVIPFAGLESIAERSDLSGLLNSVSFSDGTATQGEIDTMMKIYESLVQVKPLVAKILAVSTDNRYLSHAGMRDYYCRNARNAFEDYDGKLGVFTGKVTGLSENFPAQRGDLKITEKQIENLGLQNDIPAFCSK